MKVICLGIYDRGDVLKERVHFRALVDIDLRFYAVFDTDYRNLSEINAWQRDCYWFSSYQVKAGQNIVLYTRVGVQNTESRNDGSVYHFFFRGLSKPLYTKVENCAVIFELNNWATTAWGA